MSTRAPSPYQLQQAFAVLMAARERLLADEELAADQDLMRDWLASDPETCEAFEQLPQLARAIIALEGQEKLAKERAAEITERARRFGNRAEGLRDTLKAALEVLGQTRLREADFSVSIGPGRPKVLITDEREVPDAFCKTERRPLLHEIGEALDRGDDVPGAVRSNPSPILTIRRA